MKNKNVISLSLSYIRLIFTVIIILFSFNILASKVPVIPNKAVLRGTVMEYCLTSSSFLHIKPEQVIYRLVISVEEVEDVKGYPNFLKGKEGQVVTVHSKEKISSEIFGKKIKAIIQFRGDERGGHFWLEHIETIK